MRQENNHIASLCVCKEGGTVDGGGKATQERTTDADGAKVTEKKRQKSSNADKNKVNKKRELEKPCTVSIDTSPSLSLRQLENTTNIDVKRGIGKPCAVAIALSRRVYLRQQDLCNTRKTTEGLPGATNTNPAKDYFRLLDLITEVQNVSMAIRKFRTTHEENIGNNVCKHLGVIMEWLNLIYKEGFRQVGKICALK